MTAGRQPPGRPAARPAAVPAHIARALGGPPDATADEAAEPAEPPSPPPPGWRAGERALRLLTVATVAAAAALLTGHAWLLALAAGPVVLLVLAGPGAATSALAGAGRPSRLSAAVETGPGRCFENEDIAVRIRLDFDGAAGWIDPGITLGPGVELTSLAVAGPVVELALTARRWGRWSLGTVDVDVYDTGGLARRTVRAELGEIQVFPVPTQASLTPIPVRLPDRLGEHTARQNGDGIEVVGVRPHIWGERQRRIHWPSTTRRGSIQINQFAAERTADTVVLVDALVDFIDPATRASGLDETVRAAAGLTRAYLRSHDRVGLVSIGGTLRWLQPGSGGGYFYRIVESVLEVRKDLGYSVPALQRLPPPALPRGALVYAITQLADERILEVLGDLAQRGNPLVVIEIPTGAPYIAPGDTVGHLARRLWLADRAAMRFALRERGIPVVAQSAGKSLDLALAPLLRTRIQGRTR